MSTRSGKRTRLACRLLSLAIATVRVGEEEFGLRKEMGVGSSLQVAHQNGVTQRTEVVHNLVRSPLLR